MSSRRCLPTDPPAPLEPESSPYLALAKKVGALVTTKQQHYGDSFGTAPQILRLLYPNGIRPNQYDTLLSIVRVLDKLKRLATGYPGDMENPWLDIAGYALLALHATNNARLTDQSKGSLGKALALAAQLMSPEYTRKRSIRRKKHQ